MINTDQDDNTNSKCDSIYMSLLTSLEQIIFNLNEENLSTSVQQTMELYDSNFPYSFNIVISNLVYYRFYSKYYEINTNLKYLEILQMKEEEKNKNNLKIIDIFANYLISKKIIEEDEPYYIIESMIKLNLIDANIVNIIQSKYFAHRKPESEYKDFYNSDRFCKTFMNNNYKLSKNDWELHKQLIEEGVNPNKLSKIIRNDDIEKLQEISNQNYFNLNQIIEPSLYERCSYINHYISLIDYAAFFGSIKCFKYLLLNGSRIKNTGSYAVASGNLEIIHLCEQNHASFSGAYEAAIKFHRNEIFDYIYENKIETINNELIQIYCVCSGNYEILTYLEKKAISISDSSINKAALYGNIYLVKHFLQNNLIPNKILLNSIISQNLELVKYILEQENVNVNDKDI